MTSTITQPTSTVEPTVLIREFYRLVDAGDLTGLAALFTDDARYDRPGYPPLLGRAAIDHFYRHDRVITAGCHELDSIIASDGEIAVRGSFEGELRVGGSVRHRFAEFFRHTPDGLISVRETFFAVAHV